MVASSCRQGCDLLVARMYTPAAAATKGQQKFKHATLIKHSAYVAGSMGVGYASWWRLLNFWESQSGICWGETRVSQLHKEHVPPPPPHPNNTSVALHHQPLLSGHNPRDSAEQTRKRRQRKVENFPQTPHANNLNMERQALQCVMEYQLMELASKIDSN